MGNTDNNPLKTFSSENIAPFLNKILLIGINQYKISGRLVDLTDETITVEHRDGRRSIIRLDSLSFLSELPTGV